MSPRALNIVVMVGAVLVALGAGLMFFPAGIVVAGLELAGGALFLVDVKDSHEPPQGTPRRRA